MTCLRPLLVWALTLTVAGALMAAGGCGRRASDSREVHAKRIPLYYVDPMHPSYKSDKPGTAPDCGMKLEPVYADSGSDDMSGALHVSAAQQRMIGVRLEVVHADQTHPTVTLYGRVTADEARLYRVNVGIEGVVKDLSPLTTGSQVKKGQWLASFSAPDARATIQSYMVALDAMDRAKQAGDDVGQARYLQSGALQAADRLHNIGMSEAQIAEIERTRVEPTEVRLASPGDGFILQRHISAGERFDRGTEVYEIADLRHVWIAVDVFGVDVAYLHSGAAATVLLPGRSTRLPAAISRSVIPEFNPATQSVKLRLEADNPGFVLRPDMYVDVQLAIDTPPALTVPSDAVLDSGTRKRVFVQTADGVFEPRDIQTGWQFGDRVQVVRGLRDGDPVVVSGGFLLDSESRMRRAAK